MQPAQLMQGGGPAPPRVTVSVGPGSYTEDLVGQLARHGMLGRVIRSWPALRIEDFDTQRGCLRLTREVRWFRMLVRLTWATWNRLPYLRRYRYPQAVLSHLFDHIASGFLGEPDLFLGWSQVSLRSFRRARTMGIVTALEHPMLHVDTWQETMREEYARHAPDADLYFSLMPSTLARQMLQEYAEADFIVVPSRAAVQTFEARGIPSPRLIRVPFGVDTSLFAFKERASGRPTRVLFVGRLELLKGVHYLLQAWRRLSRRDATLTLVGPVFPEIRPWLARHADDTVQVLGERPKRDLPDLLGAADVVVFPSVNDGFGLVILEAMATGCPVIATRRSGGPDAITDEADGFLIDPADPASLCARLAWCCDHPEQLRTMGSQARERVLAEFTLEHYGHRLIEAYRRMIATHSER